ncbi:MAG TPA: amidohydrolase family protein [Miltoncostaeaceae bacterium]|nr:amidohydrolase family protein [Miltoncostaeaceae bacterium]
MADGVVADVGATADVAARWPGAALEDLGDVVLAPGFVDAHAHLEWALLGGLVPGAAGFGAWLGGLLARIGSLPPGHHGRAARLAAVRALLAGTTTVADSGPTGAGAAALTASGQRGVVHLEVFGADPALAAERVAGLAERVAAAEAAAGPRVAVGVSPHAPYSAGPALWEALARDPGLAPRPWATHLAESPDEERVLAAGDGPIADAVARAGVRPAVWPAPAGASPVARLTAHGALRRGLVAAHAVRLAPGDAAALAGAGVGVAHCPRSNAHLRCGRMPLAALVAAGVPVGLGTDSPASGGDYDLRAEARACALVHAAEGGTPPPARALLELITRGAADVLGRPDLGRIVPGARADLVAVRPPPEALPGDPHTAVLDGRTRVEAVWVDGERLVREGEPTRVDRHEAETAAAEARRVLC